MRPDNQARELQAAVGVEIGMRVTLSTKAILSTYYLRSAARFARSAQDVEAIHAGTEWGKVQDAFEEHRAYVIGSILASTVFLESCINEFFCDARDNSSTIIDTLGADVCHVIGVCWHTVMDDGKRPDILGKYQAALQLANLEPLERGSEPYQSAKHVVTLRNDLVHYKPAFSDSRDDEDHYTKHIRHRFEPNGLFPANSGNPFFPDKCLGAGCAWWVLESVLDFTDEFHRRIGITPRYDRFRSQLSRVGLPPESSGSTDTT